MYPAILYMEPDASQFDHVNTLRNIEVRFVSQIPRQNHLDWMLRILFMSFSIEI